MPQYFCLGFTNWPLTIDNLRYNTVKTVEWDNLEDVRKIYPSAEAVGNFTVLNIKGNTYRLIISIDYEDGTIYYKYFLTHAEYDKDKWKNDIYF